MSEPKKGDAKTEAKPEVNDEPAWVLFFQVQPKFADACVEGKMRCQPVTLLGQRFFAYQPLPDQQPPKAKK